MHGKRAPQKRFTEKQADEILARHAPNWSEHLKDPHVLEHIAFTALQALKRKPRKKKHGR
jgi:hypothetical protein